MDVESYRKKRQWIKENEKPVRVRCVKCRQPEFACYCSRIKRISCAIQFIILIHPLEDRKRIATGRMAHLLLEHSLLIRGKEFSQNEQVNNIIADPKNHCVILYPGPSSLNLSQRGESGTLLRKPHQNLVVFVIDGTWCTAGKMLNKSPNLMSLSRICFTPDKPSQFRVRKQPASFCYSTIEAIHQTIDLIEKKEEDAKLGRPHDLLLDVFNYLVETQLSFIKEPRYRRVL